MKTDGEYFAEFLGWVVCEAPNCEGKEKHYIYGQKEWEVMNVSKMNFRRWSEIMPVVEKICRHVYDTEGDDKFCAYLRTFGMMNKDGNFMVRFNRCSLWEAPSLLDATYEAALEFVKSQLMTTTDEKSS